MDAFEKEYLPGRGDVFFRDKIPLPRWLFALLPLALVAAASTAGAATNAFAAAALVGGVMLVALLVNLALMGLRMVVSEGGVDVAVGARTFHYPLEEIASVEPGRYRFWQYPVGRGQVKWGLRGKAFVGSPMPLGQEGIELALKNGKRAFIATKRPDEMLEAVRNALASTSLSGLRIAEPPMAAVEADEVPAQEEAAQEEAQGEPERLLAS